ncbi:nitroreductase family protein [Adhaeribacter soli]|uniref:NAD(P)H-dependent oxidoreductase n=1 Tax=Adhaeribacter soli TaxID=2607655 RepID=A0A5N1J3S0_9BACT|nr:nitroreductase family protein [Adhaeribacter soli]KAA9345541.1 NAD(P)H-dependent oxidoreductase [Adhaeribacter soli]
MNLLEALNWRYAAKRMTGARVPENKLNNILEAIRLSASSMGLQPYTILVIQNQDLKKEIFEKAAQQPQIVEASALLVFAAWDPVTEEQIDEYIDHVAEERGVNPDTLADFRNGIKTMVKGRTPEVNFNWAARQAYLALGTGLAAAASEEVDATPMEGFSPEELDKVLNLPEKGLRSVVIMTLGYRDPERDPLVNVKKVRRQKEKLFISIN